MRKHYIDNIRSLTVILVVCYHIVYLFNGIVQDGVIGSLTDWHGMDVVMYLLYPWFMVILFLVSGMSSRYYLEGHTAQEYCKARTRKLLVPSTIGILVFGWAQGYFNMAISGAFAQMPGQIPKGILYLIMCVSGIGVLWTIQVMWVCSMVLLLCRKIEKGRLLCWGEKAEIGVLLLLGIVVWGAAQIGNTPIIPVYRFGIYTFTFLLGYYVFSYEKVTDLLAGYALPLVGAAGVLGVLYCVSAYGTNYAVMPYVGSPLAIAYGWIACLAVLGCMKRFGNRTGKVWQFLHRKSFGLYVFHYLSLSACAYCLTTKTSLPAGIIYLLSALAAFGGGFLLYEIFSRIPVVRWCVLGIKKEKKHVSGKSDFTS